MDAYKGEARVASSEREIKRKEKRNGNPQPYPRVRLGLAIFRNLEI